MLWMSFDYNLHLAYHTLMRKLLNERELKRLSRILQAKKYPQNKRLGRDTNITKKRKENLFVFSEICSNSNPAT